MFARLRRFSFAVALIALLAPLSAQAAIALVGHTSAFSTTSNGFTTAGQNTSPCGAGCFIVVALAQGNATLTGAITDSLGNTWHPLTQQSFVGSKGMQLIYAFNATVGAAQTFTVSGTASFPAIAVGWFSGVQSTSDPFDVQNGNFAGGGSTVTTGSVTPSTAGSLVFSGFEADAITTAPTISLITFLDSTTNNAFGHQLSACAYEIQTTATARNPTWTQTSTSVMVAAIATFKAAAGGPVAGPAYPNRRTRGAGQ